MDFFIACFWDMMPNICSTSYNSILYRYECWGYVYIIYIMKFNQLSTNYLGTRPVLGKYLVGFSGLSLLLAGYYYYQSFGAVKEIQYRKSQLQKPIYKLSQEQLIHPPWNKSNLREWLYRRVEVEGRPIHRLQCLVPRMVQGKDGFQCVVPLVTKQNEERTQQYGLIFSRGYLPYNVWHIGNRYKIQDISRQKFIGFVSTLEELQDNGQIIGGNAVQQGRLKYTQANVGDFAESSGFLNKKQASVAVVQRLFEVGDYNERRGKRYSNDADGALDYPYYKTESGALQLPNMPWDYTNKAKYCLASSVISFVVGASIF